MDSIANFIVALQNAQAVGSHELVAPYSRFVFELAKILERQNFLIKVEKVKADESSPERLKVGLRYVDKVPAIQGVRRLSKPGTRVYAKAGELKHQFGDPAFRIISTPEGLMTDAEARKKNLGGEVICKVW